MKIIICEKPSMAKEIVEALKSRGDKVFYNDEFQVHQSKDYYITSLAGHIFELYNLDEYFENNDSKPIWRLERLPFKPKDNDFKYKLKNDIKSRSPDGKEYRKYSDIYNSIYKIINLNEVDGIINSGDPDEEGTLLVKEVVDATKTTKPVYRIWCRDLAPQTILSELDKLTPTEMYKKSELMGLARTYSDWIWGINGSRFLSIKAQNTLPVGRVKNCILGEIYKREKERNDFVSTTYYAMESECETNGINIKFTSKYNTLKYDYDKEQLEALAETYNKIGVEVLKVESDNKVVNPKNLFSLTSLQKYMVTKYKWTADRVLDACKTNYEIHKIMSYPRTSEIVLSVNEQEKVKKIIKSLNDEFGSQKLKFKNDSRIFKEFDSEAHSALHPTGIIPDYSKLSPDEKLIYEIVKNRFCANFTDDMIIAETKMTFSVIGVDDDGEEIAEDFVKKAEVLVEKGWSEFESREKKENMLPNLKVGDKIFVHFVLKERKTEPKVKYNEASIISFMECPFKEMNDDEIEAKENFDEELTEEDIKNIRKNLTIGTPATRSEMLKSLKQNEFIKRDDSGNIDITEKGIYLIECLQKLKIDYSAERTAILNYNMARINTGEISLDAIIDSVYNEISSIINEYRNVEFEKLEIPPNIVGKCPICRGDVVEKKKVFACQNNDFIMSKKPKNLFQKEISSKLASTFLNQGQAKIKDLKKNDGSIFSAIIKLEPVLYEGKYWANYSKPIFDKPTLCSCPICQGDVKINKAAYSCENGDFIMMKKVFFLNNNTIPKNKAKELIEKGRSRFISLKNNEGKIYSAEIVMTPKYNEEKEIYFANYSFNFDEPEEIIGSCPICQGNVLEYANSYRCINKDFVMMKEDPLFIALGKDGIVKSQAQTLLAEGILKLTECYSESKDKYFSCTLIMNYIKRNDVYFPKFEFKKRKNTYGGGRRYAISNLVGAKKINQISKPRPKPAVVGKKHELSK